MILTKLFKMDKLDKVLKFYAAIQDKHRSNIIWAWGGLRSSPLERSEQIKKLDIISNELEQMQSTTKILLKFVDELENVGDKDE